MWVLEFSPLSYVQHASITIAAAVPPAHVRTAYVTQAAILAAAAA
jgi:hypothetical protein